MNDGGVGCGVERRVRGEVGRQEGVAELHGEDGGGIVERDANHGVGDAFGAEIRLDEAADVIERHDAGESIEGGGKEGDGLTEGVGHERHGDFRLVGASRDVGDARGKYNLGRVGRVDKRSSHATKLAAGGMWIKDTKKIAR